MKVHRLIALGLTLSLLSGHETFAAQAQTQALPEQAQLRGIGQDVRQKREEIEEVADETTKTSGAIFVGPEKILVKQPILSALIRLDENLSPYGLDGNSEREITLRESLQTAVLNNLDIKIAQEGMERKKWEYYGALSGFLPNLVNDLQYQGLTGNYVSPAGLAFPINNNYFTSTAGLQQYFFKGGSIFFGARESKHKYKAAKATLSGSLSDVLTDSTKLYYNLALNDVLLQIRVKAVELSKGLVIVNTDMFEDGVNTELDVLQAKFQLSSDRQKLIEQEVKRRESAIKLSTALNLDPATDLTLNNRLMNKVRLVSKTLKVSDLLSLAVDNRPELKRYEELRLAAKDAVKVARASLLPQVVGTANVIGSAAKLSSLTSSSSSAGTSLSSSGAGTGAVSSASSGPLAGGSSSSGARTWGGRSLFVMGVDVQWNLGGLGVTEIAKVNAAKAEARRYQFEFNRALAQVYKEVRDSYISSLSAEAMIAETTDAVNYAREGLRVAELRFREGVGTYIDVINAQKDYTNALVSKAKAIIEFNISQAELVHAIGLASVDNLSRPGSIKN